MSSSRDNWARLVEAVVKRQQIWELCHKQSFSTIASDDLSQQTLSFSSTNSEPSSVPPSPLFSSKSSSISQVKTTTGRNIGSPRSVKRMLFSAWYRRWKSKDIPVNVGKFEMFSLHQLQVATDNFSSENSLGRGGFGDVYKGRLVDGTLVAIKRFRKKQTADAGLGFQREVEVASIMQHRNLLRLRGFCVSSEEQLLIYPYMVNGSVASCLRERASNVPPLDWRTRKRIALGSAIGLSYLHDRKIAHRDVKAANILLDEEYEAVVGDFSVAIHMDHNDTQVTTAVRGTIGHIAPEYLSNGKTSEKNDVFAYGILLLELITGWRASDLTRLAYDNYVSVLDWVKGLLKEKKLETLVDPTLLENFVEDEVEQLIQVALLCNQTSALRRPTMSEVVRLLDGKGLAEKWDNWQKECLQKLELALQPTSDRIITDSTEDLHAVELSGPR